MANISDGPGYFNRLLSGDALGKSLNPLGNRAEGQSATSPTAWVKFLGNADKTSSKEIGFVRTGSTEQIENTDDDDEDVEEGSEDGSVGDESGDDDAVNTGSSSGTVGDESDDAGDDSGDAGDDSDSDA